jgi:hypothetical protein
VLKLGRYFACIILGLFASSLAVHCSAQVSTNSAPATAVAALSGAAQAFSRGMPVHSVTLTGTVEWTAGSDHENGNVSLVANADGSYQTTLQLGPSSRTVTQTAFSQGQQCTWAGSDGIVHQGAPQNCALSVAWFLPQVALAGNLQPQGTVTTMMGNGVSSQNPGVDIRQQQSMLPPYFPAGMASLYTHLTALDIYYNPATYLPLSLTYNLHPDANAGTDIPVQVQFSNYQTVEGITVPFLIQRYVNGVLDLNITISAVTRS